MKKLGRPKKVMHYPSYNFTYVMYDLMDKKTKKVVRTVDSSEDRAKSTVKFAKIKITPTKIKALTDKLGHQGAHNLLKKYGDQWICKNGQIFFQTKA